MIALERIRERMAGLVSEGVLAEEEALRESHARAVWTCLTEPGDAVAGAAIDALGAADALDLALEGAGRQGSDERWNAGLDRWMPRVSTVDDALDRARRCGSRLLTPLEEAWPVGLSDLGAHAPHAVWVRGEVDAMAGAPGVALVGARAATAYGEHVATEFSAGLTTSGVAIVSGGAYGIDGMAHRAALAAGGTTIAVLAGGVDRLYPAGHADMLRRVAGSGGAVIAEAPCGTTPTKWRFLQRNRLIAALSAATVVVEAGWRSGSLNTAGHAASLGRPLGAVPGPVTSAASAGCHRLLREYDARCVTSVDEIRELLGETAEVRLPEGTRTDHTSRLADALSTRSPRPLTDVARRAGFSVDDAQTLLGFAELEGTARRTAAGWLSTGR